MEERLTQVDQNELTETTIVPNFLFFHLFTMTDIISVFTSDFGGEQVQAVSSKILYEFLELNKSNYSKWIQKTIKSQGEE